MRNFTNQILQINRELLFLIFILLLSFLTRWYGIESIPYGIEGDEFSWTTTSFFHQYNLPAASKGIYSLHDANAQAFPVSIKINQLSFALFGSDFLSPRKMLVLLNIFSLMFFYVLVRQFLSKEASLVILLLYSFSTYKLIASRIALPGAFSEILTYPALVLPFLISPKKRLRSCIALLLSGIVVCLSLLTYNLAYTLPLMGIAIIVFIAIKCGAPLKDVFLFAVIFLLPILLTSQLWWPNLQQESRTKVYVLDNSVFNFQEKTLSIRPISNNIRTIGEQLFASLTYSTSDMLVSYPGPLINRVVGWAFLIGLLLVSVSARKYWPLLVWFLLTGGVYQVLLGLYVPRMWILTIGSVYLLFGVALDRILALIEKLPSPASFIFKVLVVLVVVFIVLSDFQVYKNYAVKNPSYLTAAREIIELVKEHQAQIGNNLIFVLSTQENLPPNPLSNVYATTSFYYLAQHPEEAGIFAQHNRESLKVFTEPEFKRLELTKDFSVRETIVSENGSVDTVKEEIEQRGCQYRTSEGKHFTEFVLLDCTYTGAI